MLCGFKLYSTKQSAPVPWTKEALDSLIPPITPVQTSIHHTKPELNLVTVQPLIQKIY